MTDICDKFYPYYRISFLVNANKQKETVFSIPEDITNPSVVGNLATNIEITKNQSGILSTLSMKIYNLSENHRALLFQEPYWIEEADDTGFDKRIYLEVGYLSYKIGNLDSGESHLTWCGVMQNASSYKEGESIVTEIVANQLQYYFDNVFFQFTINEGESISNVFNKKINNFFKEADFLSQEEQNLTEKTGLNVSQFFPERHFKVRAELENDYIFKRPIILNHNFSDGLKFLQTFIPDSFSFLTDTELVITDSFVIGENEPNNVTFEPSAGLQSTPRIYGNRITLTSMFEPRINMGYPVTVKSIIQPNIDGVYKVLGYTHRLTLGDGTRPSAITSANLVKAN